MWKVARFELFSALDPAAVENSAQLGPGRPATARFELLDPVVPALGAEMRGNSAGRGDIVLRPLVARSTWCSRGPC